MTTTIDNKEIYTVGDIHGYPQEVVREMRRYHICGAAFLLLGDCGLGMGLEKLFPHLQAELEAHDNIWYLLRGNHDNPVCYAESAETGYDRIRLLHDGDEVLIHGERGLVLGGGLSIDRGRRRLGESYWAEEGIRLDPAEGVKGPIDFVLAHISPEPPNADATVLSRCAVHYHDATLLRDAAEEQHRVQRALALLHPARWYAGHWHLHADFMAGKTRVLVHDCNELCPW